MINAKTFINELNKVGIEFYTGVPDSLMSEFSKSLHFDFDDKNHIIATKSIVAKKSIKKGENFIVLNITCKRPGNGISPLNYWKILQKKSTTNYKINELIKEKI